MHEIKQIISEINRPHYTFLDNYFELGKIDKVNLSKTISKIMKKLN